MMYRYRIVLIRPRPPEMVIVITAHSADDARARLAGLTESHGFRLGPVKNLGRARREPSGLTNSVG